jgi:malate synthase
VWQWIRHEKGVLEDGRNISPALVREMIGEEMEKLKNEVGEQQWPDRKFEEARRLFSELVFDSEFAEFLTLPGSGLLFQFDQKG